MTNNKLTNFIQFEDDNIAGAVDTGRISTLTHDIEIRAVPFTSANERAPTLAPSGNRPRATNLKSAPSGRVRTTMAAPSSPSSSSSFASMPT